MLQKWLIQQLRAALLRLKEFAKSNRVMRALFYDLENQEIFTDLRWHSKMLADSVRVDTYRIGIARHVRPGDVVIDLGTGTGLLAFFAAKSRAKKVYAIDHSNIIEVAKEIAKRNGFGNIQFVKTNSRAFSPPEKADLIIHEQMNQALFGENLVENLLDLKKRALKSGGAILPGQFDLFIEPVVMKDEYFFPYIWEIDNLGLDLKFLRDCSVIEPFKSHRYRFQSVKGFFVDRFLCSPEAVMSIDINKIHSADEIPKKLEISRTVAQGGVLEGFCVYFRAHFDEQTSFDTSPMNRQTSWENLVFRAERKHFGAGDQISYSVELPILANTASWRVTVRNNPEALRTSYFEANKRAPHLKSAFSP